MDYSCKRFSEALAAKVSVPGGGGAAALVGALGAALCSMAGNYTLGKKKYAAYEADIERLLSDCDTYRIRMLELADEDARAFEPLSKAYAIPKDDPDRAKVLEEATLAAITAPLEMMRVLAQVMDALREMQQKGSVMLMSDVACGAILAKAALEAASLNVFINTKSLQDRDAAAQVEAEADTLLATYLPMGTRISEEITAKMRGNKMTELWKGAPVAAALTEALIQRADALKARGIEPTLAIVRVGEKPDDLAYERGAEKRCEKVGITVRKFVLPETYQTQELMDVIRRINEDPGIHGCLMFRPLANKDDEAKACALLSPAKDVDCITAGSLAKVFSGTGAGFAPCTAQAVMELLKFYGVDLTGKRVTVVGRSLVIGKPVSMMLQAANATVTMCHTKTKDLAEECRHADILVAAVGRAATIGPQHLADGQIVIDVGINVDAEGKLCGDVDAQAAEGVVSAITPVPGGVGTVTSSILASHVIEAAELFAAN